MKNSSRVERKRMLREPLSDKDIQDNFNRLMYQMLSIGASGIRSDTGLDIETMQAIDHVAQAYPKPDLVLIQNAKRNLPNSLIERICVNELGLSTQKSRASTPPNEAGTLAISPVRP